jgi:hypothetical protein
LIIKKNWCSKNIIEIALKDNNELIAIFVSGIKTASKKQINHKLTSGN